MQARSSTFCLEADRPARQSVGSPAFTNLENLAVRLGTLDDLDVIRPVRCWAKLLDILLRPHRPKRLANPKLEALRRYVWALTTNRRDLAPSTYEQALEAGCDREQLDYLSTRFSHQLNGVTSQEGPGMLDGADDQAVAILG